MELSPKEMHYETIAATVIERFAKRQIEAYYVKNKEEALEKACSFLNPGCSVAWGGSSTLNEVGLIDALHNRDCVIYDRFSATSDDAKREIFEKIAGCDFYFMSANAITSEGHLVNIDGIGNRVASLIHGPQNVIVIAGMNKVTKDVPDALHRIQTFAAPPNAMRLGRNTPCAKTGKCSDCLSPECICSQIVITRRSHVPNRIKVILVGEELGF